MSKWSAGWNQPGYLPESDPAEFDDYTDAVSYLVDEIRERADDAEDTEMGGERDKFLNAAQDLEWWTEHEIDEPEDVSVSAWGWVFWIQEN